MAHISKVWRPWGEGNGNHGSSSASTKSWSASKGSKFPEVTSFEDLLVAHLGADPATNRKIRYQVSCYEDIALKREAAWYISKDNQIPKPAREKKVAQALKKIMKLVEEMKALYDKYCGQRIITVRVPDHLSSPLPDV